MERFVSSHLPALVGQNAGTSFEFATILVRTGAAEAQVLLLSICLRFSIILSSLNLSVSLQRAKERISKS